MLALLLALVVLTGTLGGCFGGNTRTAATYTGGEIPSGVYIYYLFTAYGEAYNLLEDKTKDVFDQQVEGVAASQWITERAQTYLKNFAGVEYEFAKRGLVIDENLELYIKQATDSIWASNQAILEPNGIARSSVEALTRHQQKLQALFEKMYGEGGEFAVSEDELLSYYENNYRRVLPMIIPKFDEDQVMLSGDALTAREVQIQDYFKRAQSGEKLFDLILEYEKNENIKDTAAELPDYQETDLEMIVSRSSTDLPADFVAKVFEGDEQNVPVLFDEDSYSVIFERHDILADRSNFEASKPSILWTMKNSEFEDKFAGLAGSAGFAFNNASLKRYTPEKLVTPVS
jgi:hypothetical protein